MYDIIVIGAGVIGSCIARELSRFDARILVLEKETDVCEGTSKANSAIIHGGFDALPGTKKARYNVEGCRLLPEYAEKLDFSYRNNGSMVVCTSPEDLPRLKELYDRGIANGAQGLRLLDEQEARELEPALADEVCGALLSEAAGIVCPFGMTIAFAENAAENGAEFRFSSPVTSVRREEGGFTVETEHETFTARAVVNAAGVYAGEIHNMVSADKLRITPRRGQYMLLDRSAGSLVDHTVFQLPTAMGKGVLVTPTVHGNLLLGPTAEDLPEEDRENTATTADGLEKVRSAVSRSVKNVPLRSVITSFAGLRAHEDGDDFIIGQPADCPGFFDAAGIESPGLSSAPAIGRDLAAQIADLLSLKEKKDFKDTRKGIPSFREASPEERARMIEEDPAYGQIVCRCETVTEGEILASIRRPLGATTLDGVKRRTRAGMGRCQSGFCSGRVMQILAEEQKADLSAIRKNGPSSVFVTGTDKDAYREEGGRKA